MNQMVLALVLFVIMYILLLIFSDKRWIIALSAAALFTVLGIVPLQGVLPAINWNVLMMLAGTMAIVELFIESKMPRMIKMAAAASATIHRLSDRISSSTYITANSASARIIGFIQFPPIKKQI